MNMLQDSQGKFLVSDDQVCLLSFINLWVRLKFSMCTKTLLNLPQYIAPTEANC